MSGVDGDGLGGADNGFHYVGRSTIGPHGIALPSVQGDWNGIGGCDVPFKYDGSATEVRGRHYPDMGAVLGGNYFEAFTFIWNTPSHMPFGRQHLEVGA